MGQSRKQILSLTLCILAFFALCPVSADDNSGASAKMSSFILPQYRTSDSRLQFIIFGYSAVNKGAHVYLDHPMIDIVQDFVKDLNDVKLLNGVKPYPRDLDSLSAAKYWLDKRHCRALVFADEAVFDKTTGILTSDGPAFFRSREIDADGIGFDAYHERKFIHIRSNVKVTLRLEHTAIDISGKKLAERMMERRKEINKKMETERQKKQ